MSCFTVLVSIMCCPCAFLGLMIKFFCSLVCCFLPSARVVGIFSRSSSDDYDWLTKALKSSMFNGVVKASRSVYISNRGEHRFREAVQACDVAILYHTKNHGRINITNVTDSMYDDELQYMYDCSGRANVIVMVDDLEKGDDEEKRRILHHQPDIEKHSQDLVLVTRDEKRQPQLLERKLQHIKLLVSGGSWTSVDFRNYLVSMSGWVQSNVLAFFRSTKMIPRRRGRDELDKPLLVST